MQSKLMLIENSIIPDSFRHQASQRNRQMKRKLFDDDDEDEELDYVL